MSLISILRIIYLTGLTKKEISGRSTFTYDNFFPSYKNVFEKFPRFHVRKNLYIQRDIEQIINWSFCAYKVLTFYCKDCSSVYQWNLQWQWFKAYISFLYHRHKTSLDYSRLLLYAVLLIYHSIFPENLSQRYA